MTRLFSRSAGLALLLTGAVATFLIALFLILTQIIGEQTVIQGIKCQIGLSEECLLKELRAERAELEALRDRHQELEALYARLQAIDHAASSYVVFHEDHGFFSGTVHTGHRYASLIDPSTFTGGWCYLGLDSNGSLARNFFLADMDAGLRITPRAHSEDDLRDAGLSERDVAKALKRCSWPEGKG